MLHPATCKPRELLPASLLPYRQTWQPLVHALPTNAYVIVTDLENQAQRALILCLVQQLRRRGEMVFVLSVGRGNRSGELKPDLGEERTNLRLSAG
jgi:hypothetical protein